MNVKTAIADSFVKLENDEYVFFIDKDFPAFKGHFPRYPLLPGIVQIEIALFCISMRLNKEAKLAEIVKTKFIKPALPDTELCVSLSGTGEIFDITVKDANEIYSHMRLRVAV